MSRKRRRRQEPDERDDFSVASREPAARPLSPPPVGLQSLLEIEDRRTFHPEGDNRPVVRRTGAKAQKTLRDRLSRSPRQRVRFGPRVRSQTNAVLGFVRPEGVVTCVRRHRRKEVLFAKKKAGRGGRQRPRRLTWRSQVGC